MQISKALDAQNARFTSNLLINDYEVFDKFVRNLPLSSLVLC